MPLNYFAEKHLGKNRPAKFVYEDAWGSVVARNEAWVVLENAIEDIQSDIFMLDIISDICRQQERYHNFDEYELACTNMERFWEQVIKQTKEDLYEIY